MFYSKLTWITLLICLIVGGCENKGSSQPVSNTSAAIQSTPTAEEWQRFAQLRIAFGHQSVGFNILDGVAALAKEQHVAISISETQTAFDGPAIHHFRIGRNEEPASKLTAFDSAIKGELGATSDIAMMKFCYIDFGANTDPQQLAKNYIAELDNLAQQYPAVHFVPLTAPLTTVQTGPKAWLKQLTGNAPAGYVENARRKIFNGALRIHYASTHRLFDIAALESDHGKIAARYENQLIEALDPALTDDGGHLNSLGQRLVGAALVHHLAGLNPQP